MPENQPPAERRIAEPKQEALLHALHNIILYVIKALAILMVVVILASLVDVIYIIYDDIFEGATLGKFHVEGILRVLGAFIAVLIAIEIYNLIVVYIREDSIQAKVVLSTALIAIARKIIIFDYKSIAPSYIYATAAMVVAVSLAYWVVTQKQIPPTKPLE